MYHDSQLVLIRPVMNMDIMTVSIMDQATALRDQVHHTRKHMTIPMMTAPLSANQTSVTVILYIQATRGHTGSLNNEGGEISYNSIVNNQPDNLIIDLRVPRHPNNITASSDPHPECRTQSKVVAYISNQCCILSMQQWP